jgi:hypothetical protein
MYTFRFSGLFPWKRHGTAGSPCPSPGPGLRPPTPEGTRTAPATVSLFAWVLICSRCMSRCWRTEKCERGSATYSDMLIEHRIFMHAEKWNTHGKEIFSRGKTAETRNSPLPCSSEDENAVICTSKLSCVVMEGSLSIETKWQLLLPIYWPLKIDKAGFHTLVKVCCRELIWRVG